MTEPSDEELERAERIRKLRSGGARSRGHEVRERRREQRDLDDPSGGEGAEKDGAADPDEGSAAEDDAADDTDSDESPDGPGSIPSGGEADVLEMAAALPEDGSLFVVPLREGLRRQFNKVAEQLHLRYGFEYGGDLDADHHVRPLALYLGVQALEDGDVEDVRELLASVEELEVPEAGEE